MKPIARIVNFALACAVLTLPACATLNTGQGRVAIAETGARAHLEANLTTTDLMAFAEQVTNKMLASPQVAEWGSRRPKLIVGYLVNNTDNPNLRVRDMYDRIQEVIFNANVARVVDHSANKFDYVVKCEISSSRQYGEGGEQLAEYVMTVKLFDVKGELKGQWSDRLNLAKARRNLM